MTKKKSIRQGKKISKPKHLNPLEQKINFKKERDKQEGKEKIFFCRRGKRKFGLFKRKKNLKEKRHIHGGKEKLQ